MLIRNSINQKPTAATRLRSRLLFAVLIGLSLSSCLTSLDEEVEINPSIAEDIRYDDVYHGATNQYEVIENFETKYVIHATHLSADFRQAIADRHRTLFEDPTPILSEASAKTGFFISLYVANDEREDLRDQNLWNIILKEGDQSYSPVLVKKLSRKERWKAYFPAVNLWTQEYLVIFDSPAGGSASQQLVNQSAKVLLITNPDAKVRMSWNETQE